MSFSIWRKPPSAPQVYDADVAIIGAGITGLSLAYWLLEARPNLRVTLVERGEIGSGASGRNAGFVTAGSTAYLFNLLQSDGAEKGLQHWEKKQESLRLMREHLLSRFTDIEVASQGSTTLYRDGGLLEETAALLDGKVSFERVSTKQLLEQRLEGFTGGLRLPHEGSLHPLRLLQALQLELLDRGARFITEQAAAWVENGRLQLERDQIRSGHVFLATNGLAPQFAPLLKDSVIAKRAQMLALDGSQLSLSGNFYDPSQRVYFRRHRDGSLLIGGLRLLDEATENSDFDKVTQVIQQGLENYGRTALRATSVLARWSGTMGFTADEKPLRQELAPGLTFVGAYSGHGMGMAFGHARAAVKAFLA